MKLGLLTLGLRKQRRADGRVCYRVPCQSPTHSSLASPRGSQLYAHFALLCRRCLYGMTMNTWESVLVYQRAAEASVCRRDRTNTVLDAPSLDQFGAWPMGLRRRSLCVVGRPSSVAVRRAPCYYYPRIPRSFHRRPPSSRCVGFHSAWIL